MAREGEIDSVEDVRSERERLEFRVHAFLRRKGWNHTSGTPGSLWLWEREIDGRRILADLETALSVQESVDARAEVPR